jgi:hypothetical protein
MNGSQPMGDAVWKLNRAGSICLSCLSVGIAPDQSAAWRKGLPRAWVFARRRNAVSCVGRMNAPYNRRKTMSLDRAVMMFAGFMVLASLALGFYVSPYWYLLTAFVGLNLMQASVTSFCPAAMAFKKIGCKQGTAFK